MPDDMTRLEVAVADREALALCLALGTLEAMRSGVWPMEAGIWTLGRPVFWRPLEEAGLAAEVLAVLQSADELDALETLAGRPRALKVLRRMIATVKERLADLPDKSWYALWEDDGRDA